MPSLGLLHSARWVSSEGSLVSTSNHGKNPDDRKARRKRLSGKVLGWVVLIGIALLVGVPLALLAGAGDAIFDSPQEGLKTFFGTIAIAAILFLGGLAWDALKDRWKERHQRNDDDDRSRK